MKSCYELYEYELLCRSGAENTDNLQGQKCDLFRPTVSDNFILLVFRDGGHCNLRHATRERKKTNIYLHNKYTLSCRIGSSAAGIGIDPRPKHTHLCPI